MSELKVQASTCHSEPMVQADEVREKFVARLKKALAEAGIPEWGMGARLASSAKVTAKAASKWLNGESMPGRGNMIAIAEWLGVRLEWLAHGEGAMRASDSAAANSQVAERIALGNALFGSATPRSQALINRINALEAQGKLKDEDLKILEQIIERFSAKT